MTLEDLIRDVTGWHVGEFGPGNVDDRLAKKLIEEAREFEEALWLNSRDCVNQEAADCLILLCAYAGRHDVDLIAEARKKLEILKHPERNQKARDAERGIV